MVTIIVLLILAGISISLLSGDNGILQRTAEAKEKTVVAQEEESAKLTFTEVQMELAQGKSVDSEQFQKMIDGNYGTGNATGTIGDSSYIITVKRTGINYQMDSNGNIDKLTELPIDFAPGKLEQSGNTYTINSIEDLVAFAYNVNSGEELYENKLVILGRNLDFKGHSDSYVNEDKKYKHENLLCVPDENSSTSIRDLMTNENETGFIPVGGFFRGKRFKGTFDGKGKEISNMFSAAPYGGLFGQIDDEVKISNLNLTNCNIKCSGGSAGGIVGACSGTLTIENCSINGRITSGSVAGGIVGQQSTGEVDLLNCTNTASITSTGGIIGIGIGKIYNCKNLGSINSIAYIGGIAGSISNSTICNCYNTSDIEGKNATGGIAGTCNNVHIINCCNEGVISTTCGNCGGIIGQLNGTGEISKCYNFKNVTGSSCTGGIVGQSQTYNISNCYNSGNIVGTNAPVGGISGANGAITYCYNVGDISGGNNNSNIGEIIGYGSTDNTCKYLKKSSNANHNGAKDEDDMSSIMSIANYISLINTYVTNNNLDNTKIKLKTWKSENELPPVFAE